MSPKRILKFFRKVSRKFPINNRSNFERFWVNKDVVLSEIIVAEHEIATDRRLPRPARPLVSTRYSAWQEEGKTEIGAADRMVP
jgi:hypothetical protein